MLKDFKRFLISKMHDSPELQSSEANPLLAFLQIMQKNMLSQSHACSSLQKKLLFPPTPSNTNKKKPIWPKGKWIEPKGKRLL